MAAAAVGRVAGQRDLTPNVAVPPRNECPSPVLDFLEVTAGGVDVDVGRSAGLAAEQLIEWHARSLRLDVPERLVDAGHRVVQDWAAPPVRAEVHRLPDVLNVVGVAAEHERLQ